VRPPLPTLDLGRLAYAPAFSIQRALHAHIATQADPAPILDTLLPAWRSQPLSAGVILLVEHEPVITLSLKRNAAANILLSADALAARHITIEETDRGGDVTYHAPGQLVVYPILRLDDYRLNLSRYMRLLEQTVINTLETWGVHATRITGKTGVWVGNEKICAMGVRIGRGTTMHGLALNVDLDLAGFNTIIPCGLADAGVTSLQKILGPDQPDMQAVKAELTRQFNQLLTSRES